MGVDAALLPATVNIQGWINDQWSATVLFKDSAGSLLNMSAGTYTSYLRTNKPDAGTAGTLTVNTTNAATGTIVLTAGTITTGSLAGAAQTSWAGYWDLQRDQGSGNVRTLLAGSALFTLDATR
jgi:hypothetical protein